MNDYDIPELETIAQKTAIGTDSTGATHYFDRLRDMVHVVDDGAVEHSEPLNGRGLTEWASYVEAERGWDTLKVSQGTFAEHLIAAVGGA